MNKATVEPLPNSASLPKGEKGAPSLRSGAETLLSLLERHRNRPDTFCYFLQDEAELTISYVQLFTEASRFRRIFEDAGIQPGALVIIATEYSPDGLFAFIGAVIGGFVPAFLAPFTERQHLDQFAKTLLGVIEYTRPGAIVASPQFDRELIPPGMALILTSEVEAVDADPARAWATPGPGDVAFMQFSSGSTGLRKGVALSHRCVVAQIQAFLQVVPLGREDVIASWLPLYHDMGLIACFIIPIATGTPVALQDPVQWARAPQRLFEAIERRRATYAWLPNFAFNHLRLTIPATTRFDLSSLKALINCSEPCKPATVDAFLGRFAGDGVRADMIGAAYAMAEAVFAVTQSPIGRPGVRLLIDRERLHTERRLIPAAPGAEGRHLLSSGRLLPGVSLCVMGEDFTPVDDGQVGQIALRGDYIFHGYHNNPQATQAAFHAGWFLTGDLGAMADGEVFITGRLKDIIIAYGRNFYAHDIEACVAGVADVKPGRVVAFAVDNEIVGSEDVVVVAETTLDPALYRKLSGRIKKAATDALGLSAIRPHPVAPGWIIKTTSGKISRKENLEKFLKERRGAEHGVTA